MKQVFGAIALAVLFAFGGQTVSAQDFEKGVAAFDSRYFETAREIFRPLAEQGDTRAQNYLALLYLLKSDDGEFTQSSGGQEWQGDLFRAHMWFNIAASFGHHHGPRNRENVEKRMTAEDISKARQMALECVANDYKGC